MPFRMLLVDDALATLETLKIRYNLNSELQVVGTATNVRDAWKQMDSQAFDIISIDIQLGDVNGLTLCPTIRQRYPEAFIVICSVEADDVIHHLALDAGAHYIQSKPFGWQDVQRLVAACHQHRAARPHPSGPAP